jgi:hypothetical protein
MDHEIWDENTAQVKIQNTENFILPSNVSWQI